MNKLAIFNDNQQENIPDKHGLVQNLKGRGSSSNRTGRYEKKSEISLMMAGLATKNLNRKQILRLL
ncbi:MAG: hypothetical protein CMM37_10760 [Rhodospirillaceae bacterium]|nr:hypothetical protein [Rhodospirillaceae bacterium]